MRVIRGCHGNVLGMFWACLRHVLGMILACIGHALGLFWECLGMFRACLRDVSGMFRGLFGTLFTYLLVFLPLSNPLEILPKYELLKMFVSFILYSLTKLCL